MSKVVTIQLKWKYTPETYLEEPVSISFEGGCLDIIEGVATAKIDPDIYYSNSCIQEDLTRQIENRLYAVQVMTHIGFNLSKPCRTDIYEDERKIQFLEPEPCVVGASVAAADLILKDKSGNIVLDTKRERLDKQKEFALLLDAYRGSDSALNQMVKSYQKSVEDPDNELVCLYEILDSLCARFGSKKNAIRKLGITNDEWREVGELANNSPLKQGRHRGKALGSLRDAEGAELETARKSVVLLIEKYLEYLETRKTQ